MRQAILLVASLGLAGVASFASLAQAQPQPGKPATKRPVGIPKQPEAPRAIEPRDSAVNAILMAAKVNQEFDEMQRQLGQVLEQRLVEVPLSERSAFVAPAIWLRLCEAMQAIPQARPKSDRKESKAGDEGKDDGASGRALVLRLLDHPAFGRELAVLMNPKDRPSGIIAVAETLLRERADRLDEFPALAAAICAVFDRPRAWEFGQAPPPLEVFDYFVKNDNKLRMSVRETPAELLVFVVDSTHTAGELEWARKKYAGHAPLAKCYNDVPYDRDHFPGGQPLKLSKIAAPIPLSKILSEGGVCRHQTHFAMHIAKAHGIPSVDVVATGSEVGHSWFGYLEITPKTAVWNFDTGRWTEYDSLVGQARDPQTGAQFDEGELSLLAQAALDSPEDRRFAAAMVQAAERLAKTKTPAKKAATATGPTTPTPATPVVAPQPKSDPESREKLLAAAVRACPAYAPAWRAAAEMIKRKEIPGDRAQDWCRDLWSLCWPRHADFTVEVLEAMVPALDPKVQDEVWKWVFEGVAGGTGKSKGVATRKDLAARVQLHRGDLWRDQKDPAKAWSAYDSVVQQFLSDGTTAVDALARCRALLVEEKKPPGEVVKLYERAWTRLKKPSASRPEFAMHSNWFRVGTTYAEVLAEAGNTAKANAVAQQIATTMGLK